MWSHDKKLIAAYRSCMQDVVQQMKDNEEVDIENVCESEVNKLMGYTAYSLEEWEIKNPIKVSERKQ